MATKGKSAISWVLLGFVLLGLGGFGVTNFSGGTSPALATVGDVEVSGDDYARSLRSEMDAMSQQMGRQMTVAQAAQMGLTQGVQARLITAAALEAQAKDLGLSIGDEAVAKQILAAPGFAGPGGQFDRARYADVLKREGLTEAEFEGQVRMDEARLMLQRAVTTGVVPPAVEVDHTAAWLTETRDLRWQELTAADLPAPVAAPDDATLKAWHEANAARFTAPEIRKLTYVSLTPEALVDTVQLDDAALQAAYEARKDDFHKPARRMVERLVYPDAATATAAKQRLDKGEVTFEQLAAERGLALSDIDLGEVTEAELGTAAAAVFGATENGVVGPLDTEVGPALIAVNAILDPVDVPFEEAKPDLRAEAAMDRAQRLIEEKAVDLQDRLAGGATLEDLAKDAGLAIGQMDWRADQTPQAGSIAAYPAFRARAAQITEKDFPQVENTDDGGIFAMRLDKVVPPTLIPFETAKPQVLADWTAAETVRRLTALADERRAAGPITGGTPALALTRDSQLDTAPQAIVAKGFDLAQGDSATVAADGRVFLVTVDKISPADPASPETIALKQAVSRGLTEGLQQDLFAAYAQALQTAHGLKLYPEVAAAVTSRMP